MWRDCVISLAVVLGYAIFVITQDINHDLYNKQILLHGLNFEIQQMHEELYTACPDIFKHPDIITTGILGRRNTPDVTLDLEIRLAQKYLADLKSKYVLCIGRTTTPSTTPLPTTPSSTTTQTSYMMTSTTESSTATPSRSTTSVTTTRSPARHAFQVLRSQNTTYSNYNFLVLQLKLPDNGLSKSENWCRDYEYLCEDFGRRPTGCSGSSWINAHDYEHGNQYYVYRKCRDVYNSDMDTGGVLGCNPPSAIADIANAAFQNLPKLVVSGHNAFGFHVCSTSYCSKTMHGSNLSLFKVSDFWESGDTTVYTVCH